MDSFFKSGKDKAAKGDAFHIALPRYSGPLSPTAPMATRLWETFTYYSGYVLHNYLDKLKQLTGSLQATRKGIFKQPKKSCVAQL